MHQFMRDQCRRLRLSFGMPRTEHDPLAVGERVRTVRGSDRLSSRPALYRNGHRVDAGEWCDEAARGFRDRFINLLAIDIAECFPLGLCRGYLDRLPGYDGARPRLPGGGRSWRCFGR